MIWRYACLAGFQMKYETMGEAPARRFYCYLEVITDYVPQTTAKYEINPVLLNITETKNVNNLQVHSGSFSVTHSVIGYWKVENLMKENKKKNIPRFFGFSDPYTYSYRTRGIMFTLPMPSLENSPDWRTSSFHACLHLILTAGRPLTGASSQEVNGVSIADTGQIILLDNVPGGNGASDLFRDRLVEILDRASRIVESCRCEMSRGCPRCIQSHSCGSRNSSLSKMGARSILTQVTQQSDVILSCPTHVESGTMFS